MDILSSEDKKVEIFSIGDTRNYVIVIEVVSDDGTEARKDTVTVFAEDPTSAFMVLLKIKDMYNRPNISKVTLVGVYKRTQLSVVEGEEK